MIRTRVCDLLGIEHPIFLGGLGGGHTTPAMVAAVSDAGGFGAQGCHMLSPGQIADACAAIRQRQAVRVFHPSVVGTVAREILDWLGYRTGPAVASAS